MAVVSLPLAKPAIFLKNSGIFFFKRTNRSFPKIRGSYSSPCFFTGGSSSPEDHGNSFPLRTIGSHLLATATTGPSGLATATAGLPFSTPTFSAASMVPAPGVAAFLPSPVFMSPAAATSLVSLLAAAPSRTPSSRGLFQHQRPLSGFVASEPSQLLASSHDVSRTQQLANQFSGSGSVPTDLETAGSFLEAAAVSYPPPSCRQPLAAISIDNSRQQPSGSQ
ncbi:uncharacterized protein LOC126665010 [Mercurialis annua]|uniref:uncharacterized protein LOC126665010 n=1 Tax=Mercurialis annua TaxID=3986 RepID=UPI00215E9F9A|nr:uncharacterized protein LOC126665010 [Mercurialis annua]